jgi:Sec-independent protein translocase protein TatA
MIWENLHTITIVAGFLLTAIVTIVTGTWRLSAAVLDLKIAIEKAKDEIEQRQDRQMREVGETVSAIRQKIHDVETWSRDTFVRRDSFQSMISEVRAALVELGIRLEKRLERMEEKIDDSHK